MGLIDDCEKYFNTKDLYEVLQISHEASEDDLKKAYKKMSLLCHPDRVNEDKKCDATGKFQTLSKVHCILTDEEKRAVYDETGCIDDENLNFEDKDWSHYWRILFPKVTKKNIDDFMKKYKGSCEEFEDLKKCYLQHEGDMDKVSESFIGYDVTEEEHYRNILMDLIKKKEIPAYPKFTKETKSKRDARIKRYMKEAKEARKIASKKDLSLINVITERAKVREEKFNVMIKALEAKYCPYQLKRKVTVFKKEADEAREAETNMDASLINAIRQKSGDRQNQFDDMIKNLEAKYAKGGKKKSK